MMSKDRRKEKSFESMLNNLIEMIKKKVENYFQSKKQITRNDEIKQEQNNTNSKFSPLSCSVDDEEFLEDLTFVIRNNLIKCLKRSSKNDQEFLLNLLMNFDFSKKKFKENLCLNRIN